MYGINKSLCGSLRLCTRFDRSPGVQVIEQGSFPAPGTGGGLAGVLLLRHNTGTSLVACSLEHHQHLGRKGSVRKLCVCLFLYQQVVAAAQSLVAPREGPMVLKMLRKGDQPAGEPSVGQVCGKARRNDIQTLCRGAPGHAEMRPPQPTKLEPKSEREEENYCPGLPCFLLRSSSGSHHLLIRQPGLPCPLASPRIQSLRAQRPGQDGCTLVPVSDSAAGSQVASEMSWASDLTGWDCLYQGGTLM